MIRWDLKTTVLGYTVIPDPDQVATWAILPREAHWRVAPDGRPIVTLYKYREIVEDQAGKQGGFLIAETDYGIPDADLLAVTAELQKRVDRDHAGSPRIPQVTLTNPAYTKITASVQLLDANGGNSLVEKVQAPAQPALYGGLGLPLNITLSPRGTGFVDAALRGGNGILQVPYSASFLVAMPPLTATVWFDADKFRDFVQQQNIDVRFWFIPDDKSEQISEMFRSSQSGGVDFEPGGITDEAIKSTIRTSLFKSLEEAVKRMTAGDIPAITEADRKMPDGVANFSQSIHYGRVESFRHTVTEGTVIEILTGLGTPTLPNITSLKGSDGKPLDPEKFIFQVDARDKFFDTVRVKARAGVDFSKVPVRNVELAIHYADTPPREFLLDSADAVASFEQYTDGKGYKYTYSFQVHYLGESDHYQSAEIETDEQLLTLDVEKLGLLNVEVVGGDIDWNLVARVRADLTYADQGRNIRPTTHTVILDQENPKARVQDVLFVPVDQPFSYALTFVLTDGTEIAGRNDTSFTDRLVVNDPFTGNRTVSVRSFGNFDTEIDTVFLDLSYTEPGTGYTRSTPLALTQQARFRDWTFPVLHGSEGKVMYSGTITFRDGRNPQTIPEQTATGGTIMIGDAPREVVVMPDLVDFSTVKLVKVHLTYDDTVNGVSASRDVIFRNGSTAPVTWQHPFKPGGTHEYSAIVDYWLKTGGSKRATAAAETGDTFLVPEVPV